MSAPLTISQKVRVALALKGSVCMDRNAALAMIRVLEASEKSVEIVEVFMADQKARQDRLDRMIGVITWNLCTMAACVYTWGLLLAVGRA